MLAYFCILGLGYIMVEIVLIQRFTLFIGYPTHAITTTIFSMLLFSAIGSLIAQRILKTSQHLQIALGILAIMLIGYIFALPPLFQTFLGLPDLARIFLSVAFIAPLALLMGMPFPTGLRQLGTQSQELMPWAWGMNGVFSVLGSVLVILISMLTSFTIAFLCTAFLYGATAILSTVLWKTQIRDIETEPEAFSGVRPVQVSSRFARFNRNPGSASKDKL